jgi:hypothetical protein
MFILYTQDGGSKIYNILVEDMSLSIGAGSTLGFFASHFKKVSFLQQLLA